jgi:D-sedoheptulose 7-phosphate isomerase
MSFSDQFFSEVVTIADAIDKNKVEQLAAKLANTRDFNEGRVFVLGVGGSAGNASHMVNDLRKLCGIEAYAPTDNASEVTARTNDEGFDTVFVEYLKVSRLNHLDTIFILSVGGGDEERNVSVGLIKAIKLAKDEDATVVGIVGKKDGYTALNADVCVVVPPLFPARVTPHSESFQAVVWHCIVSNPKLQVNSTKW